MERSQGRLFLLSSIGFLISTASPLYAATPIDLNHQNLSILNSISADTGFKEISLAYDFNGTLHARLQQNYLGYPIWGADAVVHLPQSQAKSFKEVLVATKSSKGSMDGTIYQDISADLTNTPAYIFQKAQADKALQHAVAEFQQKSGKHFSVKEQASDLIVYIDDNNKAHWAFQVSFYAEPANQNQSPAKPNFLMDAVSFKTYVSWDNIQTLSDIAFDDAAGGGFGGNKKMGKLYYDGLQQHLASLKMQRDEGSKLCYLQNKDVTVRHYRTNDISTFACDLLDQEHNKLYWNAELHAVNGGYSPDNDALFGGAVIKNMYQDWYKVPVLTENGKPMMLTMVVHQPIDNAFWDGKKMTFGDGVNMFYPLTSLGVAAHEISHGFTQQHSNLSYYGQSGGMNEAYSDMAAQAAEVYAYGKNSWQIGPEIFKKENQALRYMDKPSRDCNGKTPGNWCSIDDASQYKNGLDVHFSSGVYNHFFYLLGTSEGWDARKAFDVMVQANLNYWTSSTNFEKGACGTIKAAKDLGYDVDAVMKAFEGVKINTNNC